jgi:glycosyltransferase involved in cell wall biosynthesis
MRRALRRRVAPERLLGLRKPAPELTLLPLDPGRPAPGRSDVLVLPTIPWSYRRQRPQQLAEALARRNRRVFYGSLAGSGEPAEAAGVAPGVTLLPVEGVRREDPWERRLGGRALARAAASIGTDRDRFAIHDGALLAQSPYWGPLCETLRERFGWRIVYDCIDAHGEFPTSRGRARHFADAESRLAATADLVVATSDSLRRRLAARAGSGAGGDVRLLPNACDYGLFAGLPPPTPHTRTDPDRLTVGYVGAVDAWFDLELLSRLAAMEPDWRFEIVGGIEDVAARLPRRPNVEFLGERPHLETPELRRRFDVEIIPFRLSELTHATDPVKLYEAAAAGRAVVATPMRSLEALARQDPGIVRLAATPEAFAKEIRAAAAEGPDAVARRRAFARENTWDARAHRLDDWLAALDAGRATGSLQRSGS